MNDPHVEWLKYRLKATPIDIFDNPPPLVQEYGDFCFRLDDGILTVEMREQHYDSVQTAKQAVESLLQNWKIYTALQSDRILIDFEFIDAHIIDRNPSLEISGVTSLKGTIVASGSYSGDLFVIPCKQKFYPKPPFNFTASSDVVEMWERFQQHLEGKETYQGIAYYCVTWLNNCAKDTQEGSKNKARYLATSKYRISNEVLKTLSQLSIKGNHLDVRKVTFQSTFKPLSDAERNWIRKAVKLIIFRKGEYDYNPPAASSLSMITMAHLPKL